MIDSCSPDARFFTEFERFDRRLEKQRRENGNEIDYVSICSPNYVHDAHIRFGLRIDADAICEKPVVLNPWNVATLQETEKEPGRKVHVIVPLRHHPSIIALQQKVDSEPANRKYDIDLTCITARGRWYLVLWKGDVETSGGSRRASGSTSSIGSNGSSDPFSTISSTWSSRRGRADCRN